MLLISTSFMCIGLRNRLRCHAYRSNCWILSWKYSSCCQRRRRRRRKKPRLYHKINARSPFNAEKFLKKWAVVSLAPFLRFLYLFVFALLLALFRFVIFFIFSLHIFRSPTDHSLSLSLCMCICAFLCMCHSSIKMKNSCNVAVSIPSHNLVVIIAQIYAIYGNSLSTLAQLHACRCERMIERVSERTNERTSVQTNSK